MCHPVPTEVLRHVREAGKISQAALAKLLGTVPSALSKLERSDEADPELAARYLSAIGSELALEVVSYYAENWLGSPPTFLHPDRQSLWQFDQAQRQLNMFEQERDDPILRGPIQLLRDELGTAQAYLRRQDHVIAWVGDIGVGKTTALSHAVGFLVGDGRSSRRPAFPTGSGRVTVCETAIRPAPTFGVIVDTVDDEEIIRLTRDMIASLVPGAAGIGVSAEVARLLRNMAKMKITTSTVDDELVTRDPISDLLGLGRNLDEVTDLVVAEMALNERRERQIILPEDTEDGMQWISKLVSDINSGQDARFSLPKRITVLMPAQNLKADGHTLSVVDTRGVEGITQRPDLNLHNEDSRTLVVLCTKFADAPNPTVQRHLREAVEAVSDAIERQRRCILVLPRGDEALDVPGLDDGPLTREHGYVLRRKEIELALINAGLPPTPIYFYDARNDPATGIWKRIRSQVTAMRGAFVDRGNLAVAGVRNLVENVDNVRANAAMGEIERELRRLLHDIATIHDSVRPAHSNLIDQIAVGHHSSIAASINRRGAWDNFQFDHILGNGVRIDANLRTQALIQRIEHRLMDFESKFEEMESVVQTLAGLRSRLAEARQEFLAVTRTIGVDAYGALLIEASDIWSETARRYGQGPGYKNEVAARWREWFETDEAVQKTARGVSERLQNAWEAWILKPLLAAIQTEAGTAPQERPKGPSA